MWSVIELIIDTTTPSTEPIKRMAVLRSLEQRMGTECQSVASPLDAGYQDGQSPSTQPLSPTTTIHTESTTHFAVHKDFRTDPVTSCEVRGVFCLLQTVTFLYAKRFAFLCRFAICVDYGSRMEHLDTASQSLVLLPR